MQYEKKVESNRCTLVSGSSSSYIQQYCTAVVQRLNKTTLNIERAKVAASERVNVMEMQDHKHGTLKRFEIYARQHGTCVNVSQKSAEVKNKKTRRTLTTDRRFFRARNPSS